MFVRPDWKEADAYREIEKASLVRIAWEFLRRNDDYQAGWLKYAQHVRKIAAIDADVALYAELILTPNATAEMYDRIGGSERIRELDGRLYGCGFFAEVPGTSGTLSPLDRQYGNEWGLDWIAHPMTNYSMMAVRFTHVGTSISWAFSAGLRNLEDQLGTLGNLRDTKWLPLLVDLSLPLEVIEAAVMWQVRAQRKLRTSRGVLEPETSRAASKARYAEYLRILDGAKAGFSVSEIGQSISPRSNNSAPDRPRDKRFRAALKEATRLQTSGYRVLPLLQKIETKSKKK